MISQTTEYALRAIVFIAEARTGDQQAFTAETIAKGTRVRVGYLAKVMQALARSGLVSSQRGLHGGFTLVGDARTISVYDVVQAIDPIRRITMCPVGIDGHGVNLCTLHRGLDNVLGAVETAFKRMTIQALIDQPESNQPLCPFPFRLDQLKTPADAPVIEEKDSSRWD